MVFEVIPDWAKKVIREPHTYAILDWSSDFEVTASSKKYVIDSGIPIFENYRSSYMNQTTTWPKVDRDNPSVRALEDHTLIFDKYAEELQDQIVIDMCSGGGVVSYYLAAHYQCRVISIERAWNAIKDYGDLFKAYYGIEDDQVVRVCADAIRLPILSDSIPFVVGSSWVHHFSDKTAILREVFRVLQPGGHLVAHNEGLASLLGRGTADEDQYISRRGYHQALRSAGYIDTQVVGWSRGYRFLWWLKGSVDLIGRKPELDNAKLEI